MAVLGQLLAAAAAQASVPIYSDPVSIECTPDTFNLDQQGLPVSNPMDPTQGAACLMGVGPGGTGANQVNQGAGKSANARVTSSRDSDSTNDNASLGNGFAAELAAGDLGSGWGVWTSYVRGDYDSEFRFLNRDLGADTDLNNVLAGIDRLIGDRFLLGVTFAYEDSATRSGYNGGNLDGEGFGFIPYVGWLINDIFTADLSFGYSFLDYDQNRVSVRDGTIVTSNFDADRWFVAGNINATVVRDSWVFGGRVGILHTQEKQEGYVENGSAATVAAGAIWNVHDRNIDLTQFLVGGSVAYTFSNLEPFASVTYYNDTSRDDGASAGGLPAAFTQTRNNDDDEVQVGFGVNFFTDFGIYGSLQYLLIEGRDDFDGSTFFLNLRADL
ncbi:MAG: autotransporter outer membrane beta-barrel domain-containing protein [Gammaproteobacteria bacterium]|nr:autotransporter outer membrane beta-barrel domain-containing protein [Gammaproteobacteria bacterium]NNM00995.1 autotransporter outer membrane beta-barrel domain-containing protein [Gammaproteobacteria bacterium]